MSSSKTTFLTSKTLDFVFKMNIGWQVIRTVHDVSVQFNFQNIVLF